MRPRTGTWSHESIRGGCGVSYPKGVYPGRVAGGCGDHRATGEYPAAIAQEGPGADPDGDVHGQPEGKPTGNLGQLVFWAGRGIALFTVAQGRAIEPHAVLDHAARYKGEKGRARRARSPDARLIKTHARENGQTNPPIRRLPPRQSPFPARKRRFQRAARQTPGAKRSHRHTCVTPPMRPTQTAAGGMRAGPTTADPRRIGPARSSWDVGRAALPGGANGADWQCPVADQSRPSGRVSPASVRREAVPRRSPKESFFAAVCSEGA